MNERAWMGVRNLWGAETARRMYKRISGPSIPLGWLLTPQAFLLVPALLSIVAWLIPGTGYLARGFSSRSHVSFLAALLVLGWYELAVVAALAGAAAVSRFRARRGLVASSAEPRSIVELVPRRQYWFLTGLAAVGLLASLIYLNSQYDVWQLVTTHQLNVLKNSLTHGPGIYTLRYTATLSGAIAIERIVESRRLGRLDAANLLMLALAALLAGRLVILLMLTVVLCLEAARKPGIRIAISTLVLIAVAVFAALAPISYLRTAGSYESELGISNPVAIGGLQGIAYLGVPAQVEFGLTTAGVDGHLQPSTPTFGAAFDAILRPTYLGSAHGVGAVTTLPTDNYHGQVNVANYDTTNSALADTYADYGFWGLALILIVLAIAGAAYTWLRSVGGMFVLAAGVVLYPFAEIWRIYLFNQGIIQYLALLAILVGLSIRFDLREMLAQSLRWVADVVERPR